MGHGRGQAKALMGLGSALYELGDRDQALAHAGAALGIYEQTGSPEAARVRETLDKWREARDGEDHRAT